MTLTPAQFRADFPEFADSVAWPDTQVGAELALGATYINEDRWGVSAVKGAELVAAHFLVLAKRDGAGALPGEVKGLLTSKSVGGVSAGYDLSAVLEADAGFWNLTAYGLRYYRLARQMGAGGMQVWGC